MNKTKLILLLLLSSNYFTLQLKAMEEKHIIIKRWQPSLFELSAFNLIKNRTINSTNINELNIPNELKQYLHSFYENIEKSGDTYRRGFKQVLNENLIKEWTPQEKQQVLDKLLSTSAHNGHENLVKFLIFLGANVNAETGSGDTILMWAVGNDQIDVVKLLLGLGVNINAINKEDKTALDLAKNKGFIDIAGLLKNNGAKAAGEIKAEIFKRWIEFPIKIRKKILKRLQKLGGQRTFENLMKIDKEMKESFQQ